MIEAVALSAGVVFLAELGDKSQLLALSLTTRYRMRTVLLGTALVTVAMNLVSALVGDTLARYLPVGPIQVLAGLLFLAFGLFTLANVFRTEDEPEDFRVPHGRIAVLSVAGAFALAELGDKTMLSAMALAVRFDWVSVWIGSSIGMMGSIVLAVIAGKALLKVVPVQMVHLLSAALFFVVGVLILVGIK